MRQLNPCPIGDGERRSLGVLAGVRIKPDEIRTKQRAAPSIKALNRLNSPSGPLAHGDREEKGDAVINTLERNLYIRATPLAAKGQPRGAAAIGGEIGATDAFILPPESIKAHPRLAPRGAGEALEPDAAIVGRLNPKLRLWR
ncbi:MAG: hypothetical protein KXJ53_07360, partial [Phenylobacterium sp.]|nr:hypothetical protein [Phenylobacterium sp.]